MLNANLTKEEQKMYDEINTPENIEHGEGITSICVSNDRTNLERILDNANREGADEQIKNVDKALSKL